MALCQSVTKLGLSACAFGVQRHVTISQGGDILWIWDLGNVDMAEDYHGCISITAIQASALGNRAMCDILITLTLCNVCSGLIDDFGTKGRYPPAEHYRLNNNDKPVANIPRSVQRILVLSSFLTTLCVRKYNIREFHLQISGTTRQLVRACPRRMTTLVVEVAGAFRELRWGRQSIQSVCDLGRGRNVRFNVNRTLQLAPGRIHSTTDSGRNAGPELGFAGKIAPKTLGLELRFLCESLR
jgi:hypothetical protein